MKKMVEQGYNYLDGPIDSMVVFFDTRIEHLETLIPPSVPSRNKKKSENFWRFRGLGFRGWTQVKQDLPVPWHVRTYHGRVYYIKSTGQTIKTEEGKALQEIEKVYQTWGECYGAETGQESPEKRGKKRTEELRAIEKMSVSDSDQESIDSSSSEKGEV